MKSSDLMAIKENQMIVELLATGPNDIHVQNENGNCPFDFAVKHRLDDVIDHFVSIRGDLFNRVNNHDLAPIGYAPTEDYANYLIDRYLNPSKPDAEPTIESEESVIAGTPQSNESGKRTSDLNLTAAKSFDPSTIKIKYLDFLF